MLNSNGASLHEISENPIPEGARVTRIEAADRVSLRVATWLPGERARGTILLMQGRAEFIEKYAETIGDLRRRGYAVVAFDWRGQGGSDRGTSDPTRGHIDDFALYRRDVEAIAHQVLGTMPNPVVGLAHSMGGCIALTGAREGWLPVQRLVAVAPMIDLKMVKHPRLVRALIRQRLLHLDPALSGEPTERRPGPLCAQCSFGRGGRGRGDRRPLHRMAQHGLSRDGAIPRPAFRVRDQPPNAHRCRRRRPRLRHPRHHGLRRRPENGAGSGCPRGPARNPNGARHNPRGLLGGL
jgi:alpha-beta hydrolase superfamily lysophospholipase